MCNVLIVDVEVFGWEEEVANVNGLDNIGGGGHIAFPQVVTTGRGLLPDVFVSRYYDTYVHQTTTHIIKTSSHEKNNRSTITPTFGTTATNQQ